MPKLKVVVFSTLLSALLSNCVSCTKEYELTPIQVIRAQSPFRATVESVIIRDLNNVGEGTLAILRCKSEDGKRFSVGGSKASYTMVSFIETFKVGEIHTWPQVIVDYETANSVKLE